jgi:CRISPR-associated protein Csx10
MKLWTTAYLETPLALSVRRATGNDLDTLRYIPGTVLRGALAHAWCELGRGVDDAFRELFVSGKVRYGDLRIDGCRAAPLSARVCTRAEGDHGLADHLLQAAAGAAIAAECPECGAKRRRVSEFVRRDGANGFVLEEAGTRRIAHTAIHPRLLRVAPGQFHSSQVVSEGQVFLGHVGAETAAASLLQTFAGDGMTLYLGRGRTRGQGRVSFSIVSATPSADSSLEERFLDFNDAAHDRFPSLGKYLLFSCTLQSPALLLDDWLMSRCEIEPGDLSASLVGFQLLASFRDVSLFSGWNQKAGLPKSDMWVLKPGSAFLFGKEVAPEKRGQEVRAMAGALAEALEGGIGERRDEGLGEITICDEFHLLCAEAS